MVAGRAAEEISRVVGNWPTLIVVSKGSELAWLLQCDIPVQRTIPDEALP
jgi:hypothetical protein